MTPRGGAGLAAVLVLSACTLDLVDVDVAEDVAPRLVFTLDIEDREPAGFVGATFGASVDPGAVGGVPRLVTDPSLSIGAERFEPVGGEGRVLVWPRTATAVGAGAGAVEVVMPKVAGLPRTSFTTPALLGALPPGPVMLDRSGDWVFELTVQPPEGPVFVRAGARWRVSFHGADEGSTLLSLEGVGVPAAGVRVSPALLPPDHPHGVVAMVRMQVSYEAASEDGGPRVWLAVLKEVRRAVSFQDVGGTDG